MSSLKKFYPQTLTLLLLASSLQTVHASPNNSCFEIFAQPPQTVRFANIDTYLAEKKTDLPSLRAAFENLQLSENRGSAASYDVFVRYLKDSIHRLEARKLEKERLLRQAQDDYRRNFGVVARMNPWGAAAIFKNNNLKPLNEDIDLLDKAITALVEIQEGALKTQQGVSQNALLYDAQLIYGIAYRDYSSSTAITFARSLLGSNGHLQPQLSLAGDVFNFFYTQYSETVSNVLTSTLLGVKKTDPASRQQIADLYDAFFEKHDDSVSASLASLAFNNGSPEAVQRIEDIYTILYENMSLDKKEVLPLVGYFLNDNRVPTIDDVKSIESVREKIYAHNGVDKLSSALILSVLLNTKWPVVGDRDINQLLHAFDTYYAVKGVSNTAAGILTIATYLANESRSPEITNMWTQLYSVGGVSSEAAASLTAKILFSKNGVNTDLFNVDLEDSARIAESSSSSTDSIIDVTQGAITGDFINLDGNPFTEF